MLIQHHPQHHNRNAHIGSGVCSSIGIVVKFGE
jgi:hypothetical protein